MHSYSAVSQSVFPSAFPLSHFLPWVCSRSQHSLVCWRRAADLETCSLFDAPQTLGPRVGERWRRLRLDPIFCSRFCQQAAAVDLVAFHDRSGRNRFYISFLFHGFNVLDVCWPRIKFKIHGRERTFRPRFSKLHRRPRGQSHTIRRRLF